MITEMGRAGTPAEVAAGLRPYLDAGCRSFNLIPAADTERAAIEGTDAVRALLARGDDPPRPPREGIARGDDPPRPPREGIRGEH